MELCCSIIHSNNKNYLWIIYSLYVCTSSIPCFQYFQNCLSFYKSYICWNNLAIQGHYKICYGQFTSMNIFFLFFTANIVLLWIFCSPLSLISVLGVIPGIQGKYQNPFFFGIKSLLFVEEKNSLASHYLICEWQMLHLVFWIIILPTKFKM